MVIQYTTELKGDEYSIQSIQMSTQFNRSNKILMFFAEVPNADFFLMIPCALCTSTD